MTIRVLPAAPPDDQDRRCHRATPGPGFCGVCRAACGGVDGAAGAALPNLPLDLIEALIYGREWQLGYDKLPPLPWWLVEAAYRLFGADLFFYALAQIAVVAAFALSCAMARPLVGRGRRAGRDADRRRPALSSRSRRAKFNHDVVQLPFWALAGYAYWAALRARPHAALAAARPRHRHGAVGEIFRRRAGGAAGAVRADRPRRAQAFATPGPYVAAVGRARSWRRRISSGWCRTISCPSPTPMRARCSSSGLLDYADQAAQFLLSPARLPACRRC